MAVLVCVCVCMCESFYKNSLRNVQACLWQNILAYLSLEQVKFFTFYIHVFQGPHNLCILEDFDILIVCTNEKDIFKENGKVSTEKPSTKLPHTFKLENKKSSPIKNDLPRYFRFSAYNK